MARELRIIVNPASNGGRCGRAIPRVTQLLENRGIGFRVDPTDSLGHAADLAKEAVARSEVAVAMGGDGIFNAVAGAVAEEGPEAGWFGMIPAGTGNDFARFAGIKSIPAAIDVLVEQSTHQVDLGQLNGRYFLCIASVGLDSRVVEIAETARIPGKILYPYAALRALMSWRLLRFRVDVDGVAFEYEGYSVAVANGGSYGGGMKLAPDADVQDGLFDVLTFGAVPRHEFLLMMPKVFWGGHVHHPQVTVQRARSVTVQVDSDLEICADGEFYGPTPSTITVAPGALRLIAPVNRFR